MSNETEKQTSRVQSPEARKKTQKWMGWGAIVLVLGIAMISSVFFDNSPKNTLVPQQAALPTTQTSIASPGTISAQDGWIGKASADLKNVNDKTDNLSQAQKALLERMDKLEKGVPPEQGKAGAGSQTPPPAARVEPKPLIDITGLHHPKATTAAPPAQNLPPQPAQSSPAQAEAKADAKANAKAEAKFGGTVGISVGYMNDPATPSTAASPAQTAKAGNEKKNDEDSGDDVTNYIPSGSFARVTMLGGMDAPTGGQAQSNPQPVLLRVDGNAILPNKFKFQIKECQVIGAGFGDVSSERAYIRAESMSCILNSGETIDVRIKGYISGEDGKTGLRGRLVTKQGQLLANALMAGIGAGIGQAFQQSATTQSISPLGATSTVNSGQQLQAGVSSGVGKALDRLANYYIQLAEKTFPVIEIDAGRTVDLVFEKGVSFKTKRLTAGATLKDVAEEAQGRRRDINGQYGYFD